nr:MarR family transcriptional regulator [Kineococcus siccus]
MSVRQQRFERAVADGLGIDRTSLDVVYQLIARGPSTPTEVARAVGISTAATTQALKRLDGAGHLQRTQHASDRRKVVVSAAEATAAEADRRFRPLLDAVEELLGGATAEDLERIAWFLRSMADLYGAEEDRQRRATSGG